jgi:hypothetical protein
VLGIEVLGSVAVGIYKCVLYSFWGVLGRSEVVACISGMLGYFLTCGLFGSWRFWAAMAMAMANMYSDLFSVLFDGVRWDSNVGCVDVSSSFLPA